MTAFVAPMEVLDIILDCLHDNPAVLRACSTVCHAWTAICRPRLFKKIILDYKGDSCDRLLCALRSSASTDVSIADCIRKVVICTSGVTVKFARDDARTRLTQYANSMAGNWMRQPDPGQMTLPDGSVVSIEDRRTLSKALGPVLHSLPRVERLCMTSFDWNCLAPMSLWEAAMDRTCTGAPLSLFSGLTSVKSITFKLATFNSPSEVVQLLAQFPNLESLKMGAVMFDPLGTELPVHRTLRGSSLRGPIRIQRLTFDMGRPEAVRVVHGLLNPPFSMALRELSVYISDSSDCDTASQLLNAMRSTLESIHLRFSLSASVEKMLKSIDISGFPNLRILELEYEYMLVEGDLPGLSHFRSETSDIRHLPIFLRGLPESTEKLIFHFKTPTRVVDGVSSVYWDFTDWDMLDRVLAKLHARVPALRATFHFRVTSANPLGPPSETPGALPDIAGDLKMRLHRTVARDNGRVVCLGSCA